MATGPVRQPNSLTEKEEPMTPNDYATEFERVNEEVITFVRSCSDDQWRTNVPGENWPVGVVMHHVAAGHQQVGSWIESARDGRDIAITGDAIDSANARHAEEQVEVTASETVELLGSNGAALAALLRSLDEDEMQRKVRFAPAGGALRSTEQLCGAASGHPLSHLAHAKEALTL
jgi:DinB superfamily